jgi:hypothetical protein
MFFCNSKRKELIKSNPSMSIAESGKLLGEAWSKLPAGQRAKFDKMADVDRKRFTKELDAYKAKHGTGPPTKKGAALAAKGTKAWKDPNKPKAPTSSYMFFCSVNRSKLVTGSMSLAESGRLMGEKWAALSEKEKEKYIKMADKDRTRHEREMDKYVPPPPPAELVKAGVVAAEPPKKAPKDPNRPKGPTSSYMYFSKQASANIRAQYPDIKVPELGKMVGEQWRACSEKQKSKYNAMAAKDKERYRKQMLKYTPPQ